MALWKIYDRAEGVFALLALIATVLAVLVAAIGRSLGTPVTSAPQFAQLFLIWTCMLGADLALKHGEAIRVSALPDMLPPRGRAVLATLNLALILPFLGFLAVLGWDLAMRNWARELGASGLSYGLVTLALPVGAVLLGVTFLRRAVSHGLAAALEPVPADDDGAIGPDGAPGHAPGLRSGHRSEDLL
jgi:TRAP-type C4-dicarboxylate transport system permease small subunit